MRYLTSLLPAQTHHHLLLEWTVPTSPTKNHQFPEFRIGLSALISAQDLNLMFTTARIHHLESGELTYLFQLSPQSIFPPGNVPVPLVRILERLPTTLMIRSE